MRYTTDNRIILTLCLSAALVGLVMHDAAIAAPPPKPRIVTRVFVQDDESRTLKWADLISGDSLQLGAPSVVPGFPQLDAKRQNLVQMETAQGMLMVGVRDDDNGNFQSGWVLVDTGVEREDHGDHSDWVYSRPPRVRALVLDEKQGNPAHLYNYDDVFYLANDRLNGYTRLDPAGIDRNDDAPAIRSRAAFHQGGGGHITLAAIGGRAAYSAWIDRDGENKGRVDVTALRPAGNTGISYSFHLPHGGIHGATECQGKVFFAPAAGVCWVAADTELKSDAKSVQVHSVSLGKDGDKPRRTGSFTTSERHVAFVTGGGADAALCLVDAAKPTVEVVRVPLNMAEGNRPAGLELIQLRNAVPLAFVFHDHEGDVDAPNRMSLVEVDPNGDGKWSDARVAQVFDVGASRVEGHSGHHSLACEPDRRNAIFTNPGSGTLVVFSLQQRIPVGEFHVGGVPSKVCAVGGRASDH